MQVQERARLTTAERHSNAQDQPDCVQLSVGAHIERPAWPTESTGIRVRPKKAAIGFALLGFPLYSLAPGIPTIGDIGLGVANAVNIDAVADFEAIGHAFLEEVYAPQDVREIEYGHGAGIAL